MTKTNITMREQLGDSVRPLTSTRGDREPPVEPTLRDKLTATAVGLDAEDVNMLAESGRARIGNNGSVEVITLHGWYPATEWSVRQAINIAPRRAAPSEATHEMVVTQLVDRRRPKVTEPIE